MYNISILKIFGKDVKNFLQGLITNDINQPEPFYSLVLTPTGRFLFDIFIIPKDDYYYIEIPENDSENFIKKLNQIKFRKDVFIENLSEILSVSYTKDLIQNSILGYKDPRYKGLGYRNIVYKEKNMDSGVDLYIKDKFQYTIPDGTYDLIKEKSFPQEFGLDKLNAISFKKGCYVGQESISRIRTQGVVRKQIFKVIAQENLENINNTDIFYENEKVGVLTSKKNNLAIAQIFLFDSFDINQSFKLNNINIKIEYPQWNLRI
jgi:hypothetical protein